MLNAKRTLLARRWLGKSISFVSWPWHCRSVQFASLTCFSALMGVCRVLGIDATEHLVWRLIPRDIFFKSHIPSTDFKGKMLAWWLLTGWICLTEIVWNMQLKYGMIRWGTRSKDNQRLVSFYVLICPSACGLGLLPGWQCENLLNHLEESVMFLCFRKWGESTAPF